MAVLQGLINDIKYNLIVLEAMAFGRKEAMDFINSIQDEIIIHLVKIAIYDEKDRDNVIKHWQQEILGWLRQINRKANKIKQGRHLKLQDYMLCLNDDMPQANVMDITVDDIKFYMSKCKKWRDITSADLHRSVYAILLAQYEAMSKIHWKTETLINNPTYKAISQ